MTKIRKFPIPKLWLNSGRIQCNSRYAGMAGCHMCQAKCKQQMMLSASKRADLVKFALSQLAPGKLCTQSTCIRSSFEAEASHEVSTCVSFVNKKGLPPQSTPNPPLRKAESISSLSCLPHCLAHCGLVVHVS